MKLRRERFKGSRILFRPCVVGSKREDNARVDVIIMEAIFLSFDVKKNLFSQCRGGRRRQTVFCCRGSVRWSVSLHFSSSLSTAVLLTPLRHQQATGETSTLYSGRWTSQEVPRWEPTFHFGGAKTILDCKSKCKLEPHNEVA